MKLTFTVVALLISIGSTFAQQEKLIGEDKIKNPDGSIKIIKHYKTETGGTYIPAQKVHKLSPEDAKALGIACAKAGKKVFEFKGSSYDGANQCKYLGTFKPGNTKTRDEETLITVATTTTTTTTTVKATTTTVPPKKPAPSAHMAQLVGQYSYKEGGKSGKCMGPHGVQKCGTNTYDVNSTATKREDIKGGGTIKIANRAGGIWSYVLSQSEADKLNAGKSINITIKAAGGNEFEIKNLHDQQGQDKH